MFHTTNFHLEVSFSTVSVVVISTMFNIKNALSHNISLLAVSKTFIFCGADFSFSVIDSSKPPGSYSTAQPRLQQTAEKHFLSQKIRQTKKTTTAIRRFGLTAMLDLFTIIKLVRNSSWNWNNVATFDHFDAAVFGHRKCLSSY